MTKGCLAASVGKYANVDIRVRVKTPFKTRFHLQFDRIMKTSY